MADSSEVPAVSHGPTVRDGADAVRAAFRRSLPLLLAAGLVGILLVNAVEQLRGAKFSASAEVSVAATPLNEIVTGTASPVIDPTETLDTAQSLAQAREVYVIAAQTTHGRYGSSQKLQNATTVTPGTNTDLLTVSTAFNTQQAAIAVANAVSAAFVRYYAGLTASQIGLVIQQLRASEPSDGGSGRDHVLRSEIEKLQLLKGSSSTEAQLVEPALTATKTSPAPTKDTGAGLALGLVIGLLGAGLREAVDSSVRSDSVVEAVLGVPLIASIRSLPRRARLVAVGKWESQFASQYGLIAAYISVGEGSNTVFAISSATAGEGKTTTTANLAIALARQGNKVLVLDLDFYRPTLGTVFGLPDGTPGALQVIDGSRSLDDCVCEVRFEDGVPVPAKPGDVSSEPEESGTDSSPTLRVLTSGRSAGLGPIVSPPRLDDLLTGIDRRADIVLIDTPPALLAAEMTELAQLVDSVLLVVRQGQVSVRTLRSLRRTIDSWPAKIAGVILTDTEGNSDVGSYYYDSY